MLGWNDWLDIFADYKTCLWVMELSIENITLFGVGQCRHESFLSVRINKGFDERLLMRVHGKILSKGSATQL